MVVFATSNDSIGVIVMAAFVYGHGSISLTLLMGGGQKRLRVSSSINFDKNNHRMRL